MSRQGSEAWISNITQQRVAEHAEHRRAVLDNRRVGALEAEYRRVMIRYHEAQSDVVRAERELKAAEHRLDTAEDAFTHASRCRH